jgi:hypothetical protein
LQELTTLLELLKELFIEQFRLENLIGSLSEVRHNGLVVGSAPYAEDTPSYTATMTVQLYWTCHNFQPAGCAQL